MIVHSVGLKENTQVPRTPAVTGLFSVYRTNFIVLKQELFKVVICCKYINLNKITKI